MSELKTRSRDRTGICPLCGRGPVALTLHHLIPRAVHSRKRYRKRYDLRTLQTLTLEVCRPCHNMIHKALSEVELADEFNALEKLRQHPRIARFTTWLSRRPAGYRPRF